MASHQNDYKKASDDELFQAQAHFYRHLYSFITPMSIKWAVDLGIPDIIHNHGGQPVTLSHLVSVLHVPQQKTSCVRRIMRLLAHHGYFVIIKNDDDNEEAYALTRVSEFLVKGNDHCLLPMLEGTIKTAFIKKLHLELGKWTLGEERTLFEMALGSGNMWDFLHQSPENIKLFNESMESDSRVVRFALRDCKTVFEGLESLVDVGGGTGNTAKIIVEAFPELKCIVLDLPQVVADLQPQHNLTYVGGNMFESIPQANAVLLKWVLHDWNDEDCMKILKNCKEAILSRGKGGKVIIIDAVINEKQDTHEMTELKLSLDIAMMSGFGGKERDEKDWKDLLLASGFQDYKIFPIFGFRSLIELYL